MEFIKEKKLIDYPNPVFISQNEEILRQMKNSICKICNKDGSKGTGFFCKISLPDKGYINAFITNNHVINEKYLENEKEIIIEINKGKNIIVDKVKYSNDTFKYTNKEYDITIIEINNNDNYKFLELDENILDDYKGYIGNSIYILHYPSNFDEIKAAVSFGILKSNFEDKNYNFKHFCCTEFGSSGAPLLNLENNKIIGIHKEAGKNKQYNIGAFLYEPLKEVINKYREQKILKDKSKTNNNLLQNVDKNDKIMKLYNKLYNGGFVSDIVEIKKNITNTFYDVKKLICLGKNYKDFYQKIKTRIPAYHGTKYKNL